ncbi:MAG: 4-hydroxy-tetrahydrodipicolinate synthase [Flavobacteriales bacterium]|nr:4-hydroxy-tetrahydrodipicolinate synthase [Flavobacteriales bacterium]MCX7767427.1 4-hydroxy-tetrahydrodipicolinate synthase [Flavobacteriales bacterium]MDW8410059.1 4-hydroxy-tetrahydrodipicolinate synthase [Flavobacteriales bacterium]
MKLFQGLGIAIVTPFQEDGLIDYEALKGLIEFWIEGGADYLVVMGTTGETPTLESSEKEELLRFCISEVRRRVPVVVGIGGNDTRNVVRQIENMDLRDVAGILSVAPYYNKPNQEGLFQHFSMLAQASPLPLILYNVPGRTGSNLSPETTLRLAHKYPIIAGIKEASGNLDQITTLLRDRPQDFLVISGDDNLTLPLMAAGADGVISVVANAYPREYSTLVRAMLKGDLATARNIHLRLYRLVQLIFLDGSPGGIKHVLARKGLCKAHVRLPLWNVTEQVALQLDEEVKKLEN